MTDESGQIQPGERAKAVAALEILLRVLRQAVDCFPDDDLETILVYLTVAAASTGSHLRDPVVMTSMRGRPLPDHLHKPISGRAVAQSTGLPRETVRRRIDALVASGRLARDARGVRTITNVLVHGRNLEFARFLVHELSGASGRISRFDCEPVTPQPRPDPRP